MSESKTWIVYCLKDPRDGETRYVGVTHKGLANRLKRHINSAKNPKTHKEFWVRSVLRSGHIPVIEGLEFGGTDSWQDAEIRWIKDLRSQGCDLTNLTDGGDGTLGWNPTPQTRAKMSEHMRGRDKGKIYSAEARQRNSEAQKARFEYEKSVGIVRSRPSVSEDTRARMVLAQKGKKASEETKARLSVAHQNPTPETRKKLYDAVMSRPQEQRDAFAKSNLGRKFSEDHKKSLSNAAYQRWSKVTPNEEGKKMVLSEDQKRKTSEASATLWRERRAAKGLDTPTPEQETEIRLKYLEMDLTQKELASLYNTTKDVIRRILKRNHTWPD